MNKQALRALPKPKESNAFIQAYVSAANKGLKAHHVVPNGNKWSVKRAGASRASKTFPTQKDANAYGHEIAKKQKTELFIHGKNGLIRKRSSYADAAIDS